MKQLSIWVDRGALVIGGASGRTRNRPLSHSGRLHDITAHLFYDRGWTARPFWGGYFGLALEKEEDFVENPKDKYSTELLEEKIAKKELRDKQNEFAPGYAEV